MILLTDYSESVNSQFGEDGILHEIFSRLNILHGGLAVEVGASDGRECSNTLYLRDNFEWRRILIESDPTLFNRIEPHERDLAVFESLTSTGGGSLDWSIRDAPDFLSLDIDGNEYEVLKQLKMRPAVICVEFNQTIPWHLKIVSAGLGCSLSTLIPMMIEKEYGFIGATHCNAFFVHDICLGLFDDINKDPEHYLSLDNYTYLVTSPYEGAVAIGPKIFGTQKPYRGEIDIISPDGSVRTVQLSQRNVEQ